MRALVLVMITVAALAPGCRRDADRLEERVEARLHDELPYVDVVSDGRVVVLSGSVASASLRARAEQLAREVPGVLSVDNRLMVEQPAALTAATEEARMAASISQGLGRAGFVGIEVEVRDGVVHVRGPVDRARHDEAMRIVQAETPEAFRIEDGLTRR